MCERTSDSAKKHDCGFKESDEYTLVQKLLRTIDEHLAEKKVTACPGCLRNSMMVVAALLHFEAEKAALTPDEPGFTDGFADVARDKMEAVIEAVLELGTGSRIM